jgi:hypothetical protein
MRLKSLTCLPRIGAESAQIDVGDSHIVRLPFSQWLALEGGRGAAYDKLDSRFSSNPPLFWETTIAVDSTLVLDRKPEHIKVFGKLIEHDLEALVTAFHWYTGQAPIHPNNSVTYFDPLNEENLQAHPDLAAVVNEYGVQRRYGESGKEYATENRNPGIFIRQVDEAPFAAMFEVARQTQNVWTAELYARAAQALRLCSVPGLDWHTQIVMLVGAYESVLLADVTTNLAKTFTTRLSRLAADTLEEAAIYAAWIHPAYRLRSTLIHGRPAGELLQKLPSHPRDYVATLSRIGVIALCKVVNYLHWHADAQHGLQLLCLALDAVDSHPEQFEALQSLVGRDRSALHQWQIEGADADISDASSN